MRLNFISVVMCLIVCFSNAKCQTSDYVVTMPRSRHLLVGKFDNNGVFIPAASAPQNFIPFRTGGVGVDYPETLNRYYDVYSMENTNFKSCFEKQMNAFVEGGLIYSRKEIVFIPKIGSRIVSATDGKRQFLTYNSDQDIFAHFKSNLGTADKRELDLPDFSDSHVFFDNEVSASKPQKVMLILGKIEFGRIDKRGEFNVDYTMPSIDFQPNLKLLSRHNLTVQKILNIPTDNSESETVYQYRSGGLILGKVNNKGNFYPQVDTNVIDLAEYKKLNKNIRIYNLPGFVKRD